MVSSSLSSETVASCRSRTLLVKELLLKEEVV